MTQKPLCFCLLGIVLFAVGCSAKNEGAISGSVVVDGVAAKTGSIAFYPVDEKSHTAGATITDGKYTANVPLGKQKVQIHVSKVVGTRKLYNTPDSPTQEIFEEVLPAKFNTKTELEFEVKPGANTKDFDLKTK